MNNEQRGPCPPPDSFTQEIKMTITKRDDEFDVDFEVIEISKQIVPETRAGACCRLW